jgi:cytochrome c553
MPKSSGLRLLLLSTFAAASLSANDAFPTWAYPVAAPSPPGATGTDDGNRPQHVPDSTVTLAKKQFAAHVTSAADWHPEEHPAMPPIVSVGREPAVWACAYCHLPNGAGRPENSSLAGLTAAYIKLQVADFRNGRRNGSEPRRAPQNFMIALAKALKDDEINLAAAYFSSLKPQSFVRVVESETVPRSYVAGAMLARVPDGGDEPLGSRIIEMPEDLERAENRDTRTPYLAYVPVGSVEKGKALVTAPAPTKTQQCSLCHGPGLKGVTDPKGVIDFPRLAGRSPSYLMRQLYDYKAGTRTDGAGAMKVIVANLTPDDMVAIVAYIASQPP